MKCFAITMLFIGISIFAYSQTTFPYPKSIQGYKNNLVPFSSKNYIVSPATGSSLKNTVNNNYKPDLSVISVMPTLKLWLLPASIPNPFMKDVE